MSTEVGEVHVLIDAFVSCINETSLEIPIMLFADHFLLK